MLVRVNRNCPWNRCTFCPVYKKRRFKSRKLDEILADIDAMARAAEVVRQRSVDMGCEGRVNEAVAGAIFDDLTAPAAVRRIAFWLYGGGDTVFLQDANALLNRQELLLGVLGELRSRFPHIERITSYARAHTLARKTVEQLTELRQAGLSRIHVGLESGCDQVLELVRKGTTAAEQVEAGERVMASGIHLCLYVMPGLGGRALSEAHARDTARVVRQIDPNRVRLRSLVVSPRTELAEQVARGELQPLDDVEMVREIRRFIEGLEGCTGDLVSDHDLNLLMELRGDLATERDQLLATLDRFLGLSEEDQRLFIIGRRTHLMGCLDHLDDPRRRAQTTQAWQMLRFHTGEDDIGAAVQALRERMV